MQTVVKRVDDFEFDGTGSASAWNAVDWISLVPIKGIRTYPTKAKVVCSDTGIYCLYDCVDEHLSCTTLQDGDELFNEDVIEAFFWPDTSQTLYFEYELSPLGMEVPLLVPNHNGKFMGWVPWRYQGQRTTRRATSIRGGEKIPGAQVAGWTGEFFIPFGLMIGLGNVPPQPGTTWRANFYRIDYDGKEQTLFAWSTGVRNSFHDFEQFGTLLFD